MQRDARVSIVLGAASGSEQCRSGFLSSMSTNDVTGSFFVTFAPLVRAWDRLLRIAFGSSLSIVPGSFPTPSYNPSAKLHSTTKGAPKSATLGFPRLTKYSWRALRITRAPWISASICGLYDATMRGSKLAATISCPQSRTCDLEPEFQDMPDMARIFVLTSFDVRSFLLSSASTLALTATMMAKVSSRSETNSPSSKLNLAMYLPAGVLTSSFRTREDDPLASGDAPSSPFCCCCCC